MFQNDLCEYYLKAELREKKTPKKNPQNPPQTEVFGTKEKISITGKFQLVNFKNYTNND